MDSPYSPFLASEPQFAFVPLSIRKAFVRGCPWRDRKPRTSAHRPPLRVADVPCPWEAHEVHNDPTSNCRRPPPLLSSDCAGARGLRLFCQLPGNAAGENFGRRIACCGVCQNHKTTKWKNCNIRTDSTRADNDDDHTTREGREEGSNTQQMEETDGNAPQPDRRLVLEDWS